MIVHPRTSSPGMSSARMPPLVFLGAARWDQVKSPDPVLTRRSVRMNLHDMVSSDRSAFLGPDCRMRALP